MKYKDKNRTNEERIEMAEKMIQVYLNGASSALEVNVDGRRLREFKKRYKSENNELSIDLFDLIEFSVRENLGDTYSRFIISLDYENYVSVQTFEKETGIEMD